MQKLTRHQMWREFKDYAGVTLGLACYALGWVLFMLPYQIVTGGVTGVAAMVYYATGVQIQVTYFAINMCLLIAALRVLGWKFCVKTIYAIFTLTGFLTLFQHVFRDDDGNLLMILGSDQVFMSVVVGSIILGFGIGLVFTRNGSTGGTDIVAWIINKYKDITLGRLIMFIDIIIITSSYFIFGDVQKILFGYVVMFISSFVIDYVVNSVSQSVQFLIFSKKSDEIAEAINTVAHRGVTILHGMGWYSKQDMEVVVVMARRTQTGEIFRLIRDIDPKAFISQSKVVGVYGEGFDKIKK